MDGIALRTANETDRIALRGVRLLARLSGMSQKTTLEQTFVNQEDRAIEAVYTFPLPEGAAVCGFEVITDDRVITGKVDETGEAIDKYEHAVSEGHGAFMLEAERPDVFTIRVGNLKPKQAATIRLTYVAQLEIANHSIRVAFPTTVAPRFVTASGSTDPLESRIVGEAMNPPHVLHVPYGLSMQVEIALGRPLKSITSPSHAVHVEPIGETQRVTLAAGVTEMNRDIVLSLETVKEQSPCLQVAPGKSGESYMAVTFIPEFSEDELAEPRPNQTFFVLDCSGSMQGDSIAQAKAALELCLRSLSVGDSFNICLFGSTFQMMSSEPLPYTKQTLDRALGYVRAAPDLGGTELLAPLQEIFKVAPPPGLVRQVLVLTDGQITNEPAVMDLARAHRSTHRIFSFGIGSACSTHLVKGLARATGGAAEFITANERIDEKVLRTFSRLASPVVSDVKIDWAGADVQTLAELPPIFDGDVLTIFGRVNGAPPAQVSLRCNTAQGVKTWTLPVPPPTADDNVIATMWARRTIQSLEEVNSIRRTSVSDRRDSRARQTLIDLSKEYGLLCSLTTFIAVEHRSLDERNDGQPELRRVPVMLAQGWGGVQQMAAGAGAPMPCMAPPPSPGAPPAGIAKRAMHKSHGIVDKLFGAIFGGGSDSMNLMGPSGIARGFAGTPPTESEGTGLEGLMDLTREASDDEDETPPAAASAPPKFAGDLPYLLSLQSAEGYFDPDALIHRLLKDAGQSLGKIEVDFEAALPKPIGKSREQIIRTAAVLYLLGKRFASENDLWKRSARKATQWIAKAVGCKPAEIDAAIAALK